MVPIITWAPCNPVRAKKIVPYIESAIENGASRYSNPCKIVNIIANKRVKKVPKIAEFLLPDISA